MEAKFWFNIRVPCVGFFFKVIGTKEHTLSHLTLLIGGLFIISSRMCFALIRYIQTVFIENWSDFPNHKIKMNGKIWGKSRSSCLIQKKIQGKNRGENRIS